MNHWDMNPIPISGVTLSFQQQNNSKAFFGVFFTGGQDDRDGKKRQSSSWQFGDGGCLASVVTQDGALPTKQQLTE